MHVMCMEFLVTLCVHVYVCFRFHWDLWGRKLGTNSDRVVWHKRILSLKFNEISCRQLHSGLDILPSVNLPSHVNTFYWQRACDIEDKIVEGNSNLFECPAWLQSSAPSAFLFPCFHVYYQLCCSVAYLGGRGVWGGSNPPEILKFWQSWAEFPVPWKIHP
jgi:hypothetical protein